jgi:hypothetical protein
MKTIKRYVRMFRGQLLAFLIGVLVVSFFVDSPESFRWNGIAGFLILNAVVYIPLYIVFKDKLVIKKNK